MKTLFHVNKWNLSVRQKAALQLFLLGGIVFFIYCASWITDPTTCPFCAKLYQDQSIHRSWTQHFSSLIGWFSNKQDLTGYTPVGFNVLSGYNFTPSGDSTDSKKASPTNPDSIPEGIKSLDGKKVAIQGYVVPVMVMDGDIKSFMLARTTMLCCYGITPKMNEWVDVDIDSDKSSNLQMDVPMVVYGTLDVGEKYADGTLMSIYRLKAIEVVKAKESS